MTEGPSRISIAKAHAYGNDFLYVRDADLSLADSTAFAIAICQRFTGIGADGLILYRLTERGAFMRLINSDGSPAEVSGNGVRGLAALLVHRSEQAPVGEEPLVIESAGGTKLLHLLQRAGHRYRFRAQMGSPERLQQTTIDVDGERLTAATLWMGNPQCVVLGPLPSRSRFERMGPALATHAVFPEGTNVDFAEVLRPDLVRILIWERGAGPTLSSGTGSCASAVVAAAYGGAGRDVDVEAPGGTQRVRWTEDGVELTGWADVVLEGEWLAASAY